MAGKDADHQGKQASKVDARLIIGIVVLALVGVFILQNRDEVPLTVFFFDVTVPLWIGLVVTVLVSMGAGFILGRGRYRKK